LNWVLSSEVPIHGNVHTVVEPVLNAPKLGVLCVMWPGTRLDKDDGEDARRGMLGYQIDLDLVAVRPLARTQERRKHGLRSA
jgi:hypothetical protein